MIPYVNREDIGRVVVVLAGSRTGSSFLFSALKAHGEFIASTGEETPFYRLGGVGIFDGVDYCDAVISPPNEKSLRAIFNFLSADLGLTREHCADREALAETFLHRFSLQWPEILPLKDKDNVKSALLAELVRLPEGWKNWRQVYLQWIARLQAQGFAVDPAPYSAARPHTERPSRFEEPPYICPSPKIALNKDLARRHPLLLKTSTNVYRVDFLRALFPQAEFKWIILQRNPAAVISGLMDGWLSGGFHSHDVYPHAVLEIAGYSDRTLFGNRYWKFDMPPGWREFTQEPLVKVCAFQWHSAYAAIAKLRSVLRDPIFTLSYEELIGPSAPSKINELLRFCGAEPRTGEAWRADEFIAEVTPPSAGKWRKREEEIIGLLHNHRGGLLLDLARQFGYDPARLESWP